MRILLFCLPGLGDTLMFTPAIRMLRKKYARASVDAVTMFKSSFEILNKNPFLNKIYYFDFLYGKKSDSFRLLKLLRSKHYDISIIAFPGYRREYHLLQFFVGADRRIAHTFGEGYFTQFNFLDTDLVKADLSIHNVSNNLNLLKPLGITARSNSKNMKYDIFASEKDEEFGRYYLETIKRNTGAEKMICFHIGSMKYKGNDLKRWSKENYFQIGKDLIKRYNSAIILISGKYENDESYSLKERLGKKAIVADFSISELICIMKNSDLFLGNDGGPAHLAAGLDISTVVLFGITDPGHCRPLGANVTVIESPDCRHCYKVNDNYFKCKKKEGQRCIDYINVSAVLEKIKNIC